MITLSDSDHTRNMDAMELFRSEAKVKPFCRCDSCGYMRRKGVQVLSPANASLPARDMSVVPLYIGANAPTYCSQCEVPMRSLTLEEWLNITVEIGKTAGSSSSSSSAPYLDHWSPVSNERYTRSVKIVDATLRPKETAPADSKPPVASPLRRYKPFSWLPKMLHMRTT